MEREPGANSEVDSQGQQLKDPLCLLAPQAHLILYNKHKP